MDKTLACTEKKPKKSNGRWVDQGAVDLARLQSELYAMRGIVRAGAPVRLHQFIYRERSQVLGLSLVSGSDPALKH